jgi:hypothetical protein
MGSKRKKRTFSASNHSSRRPPPWRPRQLSAWFVHFTRIEKARHGKGVRHYTTTQKSDTVRGVFLRRLCRANIPALQRWMQIHVQ